MRHTALATLVAITALASAAPGSAQTAKGGRAPAATGNVTRAQIQAQVKQVFDRADTNKDNFMSRAEFGKRMGAVLNRTPPGTPGAPTPRRGAAAAQCGDRCASTRSTSITTASSAAPRPARARAGGIRQHGHQP